MLGDIFYSLGTLTGTVLGAVQGPGPGSRAADDPGPTGGSAEPWGAESRPAVEARDAGEHDAAAAGAGLAGDGQMLVDTVIGSAAAWAVAKILRPRRVSWPRVVVAGIGATVMADAVGRALGPPSEDRDRAYEEDPDALLIRMGAGIAMAAGYAALLYPRLPGSPLDRGLVFAAMELAAAPHGGLIRVATDTPGLEFPLKDLAVPIDEDAGPLGSLAYGIGLGLLYRPDLGEPAEHDGE